MADTHPSEKERFRHRRLRDSDIRLLKFDDEHEKLDECCYHPPRLLIEHYTRDTAPPYVALSYDWGDASRLYSIFIDGQRLEVRPNLRWCLRFMARYYKCDYLWVDAICIDQVNTRERNEQVGNMGDIYTNASTVLVWLGYHHNAESAQEYRHSFHDTCSQRQDYLEDGRILQHPYWTRMWIIQELSLARKVEILRGKHVLTWKDLSKVEYLSFQRQPVPRSRVEDWGILEPYPYKKPWGDSASLSELLTRYLRFKCTDPKDRVFALLSVIPQQERETLGHFFPDYAMSLEKVQLLTIAYLWTYARPTARLAVAAFVKDRRMTPGCLGIESNELYYALLGESRSVRQLERPKRRVWTFRFILQFFVWNRSTQAYTERKSDLDRDQRTWMDSRLDALHALSSTTLR